jgi:GNAT superfamily N-acetyltransferase
MDEFAECDAGGEWGVGMTSVRLATDDERTEIASTLGVAFLDDPMVRWPFPANARLADITALFDVLLGVYLPLGVIWVTSGLEGAMALLPPVEARRFAEIERRTRQSIRPLTDDEGARYDVFWDWLGGHVPDEPAHFLDIVGVHPDARGRGVGRALVEHGIGRAFAEDLPVFLETGNSANVPMYEHFGFRVVERANAPGGGPRIWFMRADPLSRSRQANSAVDSRGTMLPTSGRPISSSTRARR